MPSFRFLHAADIHVDSPLKGLAGQEGRAVGRVRTATREALNQLVDLAIKEKVDFMVIAGDLYDGDWRDYNTGLFFIRQMGRLREVQIPVYLIHGNHDAASQITRQLELPENVHVFDSRKPKTLRLRELNVALHGQSFHQRKVRENLAMGYPDPVSGAFNIGVLHTALGGIDDHGNYAPCSRHDLVNKGYDYWALGHVHRAQLLHEKPHIVFSGNLQGRHIRETGAKGAYLVTVEDGEIIKLEFVPCDVVRWTSLSVSLSDAKNISDITDRVRSALELAVDRKADGRLLACRIVFEGRTDAYSQLVGSEDDVLAAVRACALGLGNDVAWIEKIVNATESVVDPQILAQREDAIGELLRMLGDAGNDDNLLKLMKADIGELMGKLPYELSKTNEDEILKAAIEGQYAVLFDSVAPYLPKYLTAPEE